MRTRSYTTGIWPERRTNSKERLRRLWYNKDHMRFLRGLLAFVLALILIASSALALGSFAVSRAVSEDAVRQAITETDAVGQLTGNIIIQNTINLGGEYGETMQAILKSDAMTDFFTEYTARSLQAQVYGTEMEELGSDALNEAFSRGMDECLANGTVTMDEGERMIFDQALNTAMPNLTEGVNFVLDQMELTDFVDEETSQQIEIARQATSDEVRYGAAGIAIMVCLLLIALYWRSKMGFLISGLIILLVAGFFYLLPIMIGQTMEATGSSIVLSRKMLFVMVSCGSMEAVRVGAAAGAALIAACPVFKLLFRKRRRR